MRRWCIVYFFCVYAWNSITKEVEAGKCVVGVSCVSFVFTRGIASPTRFFCSFVVDSSSNRSNDPGVLIKEVVTL